MQKTTTTPPDDTTGLTGLPSMASDVPYSCTASEGVEEAVSHPSTTDNSLNAGSVATNDIHVRY